MDDKKEAFRKRLLATFRVEAAEHIQVLSSGLMELEKSSAAESHSATLEAIFREAHSLKGAARAVNIAEIETICQSLEDVFSSWQRKETAPNKLMFDALHRATDTLERILGQLSTGEESKKPGKDPFGISSLIASLKQAGQAALPQAKSKQSATDGGSAKQTAAAADAGRLVPEARVAATDTVRLPASRLGTLLLEAEELLMAKQAARLRAAELDDLQAVIAPWKKTRAQLRLLLRSLAQPVESNGHGPAAANGNGKGQARARKLIELLEQDDHFFQSLEGQLEALARASHKDRRSLDRMVDQLLASAKQVVMLPAASLLETFPRLARDLARDRGKVVELEVQGADIEMDRRILEEVKEPLLHLLRNSIDHGIESPSDRLKAGKPEHGVVRIALRRIDSNKAELLVSDDGRGIQVHDVRTAALKLGVLSPDEAKSTGEPDRQKVLDLVFRSGISTSPIITDISGRGLGLAIVREKVEKLGGEVSIENHPGAGTTFRMILPFTRAAFRGVIVRVGEHLFALPSVQVGRVLRFRQEEVKTVENCETLLVEGRPTALVRLSDALALSARELPADSEKGQAVLVGSRDKRIAIRVDEVLDEQEILAKSLGKQLQGVKNMAGATVLGNGRVVPILDVPDLLKSAAEVGAKARPADARPGEPERKRMSILVAEDSITARSLLKNILETAGYEVTTAVDGAEAFAALRTAKFDLLVSDVDMPRLNGFGLTAKVRGDPGLADLPVVLVTALGSREDRERGIDAGANAYIVKSSFDESDLLEVLRRLL